MRVLIVGLGDIARKAYLPVVTGLPGLQLHFASRNQPVLRELGEAYRVTNLHASAGEALAASSFDAAFVHAATDAHPSLVELLLRAGVHVLVDKPLAYSFDEAARLVSIAEEMDRLLMVGFNRRYAPDYTQLLNHPRELCIMQKHRLRQLDEPRRTIFDDFIHVVDTLLFLSPARPERISIETQMARHMLRSVSIKLASERHVALGIMHRDSGLDEECLSVVGNGEKRSVLNLSTTSEQIAGIEHVARRPDWTSVSRQRGFEAMCTDFIQAVQEGRTTRSRDILETHRLCEEIVRSAAGKRESPAI
jgi:virulence factor